MPSPEPAQPLRRLHAASLLINLLLDARKFIVPGLLVLVFARGERWEIWLMALFVPAALLEYVRCATVRFGVRGEHFVVRRGLVFREERHIPFDRIQNLDLVQTILHRAMGVADVHIETASGQEPEAVLRVLSMEDVAFLRTKIFAHRPASPGRSAESWGRGSAEDEHVLLRLPLRELVKLGVVSNRGLALVAAALGLTYEFDLWDSLEQRLADESTRLDALEGSQLLWLAVIGVATILAVVFLLSVAWGVVRLWGFRLTRNGDDLRSVCGLLTRWSATIPRRRIQFLSIQENVLHRRFSRVCVRVETAGGVDSDDTHRSRKWFAPLLPLQDLEALVEEALPGICLPVSGWIRLGNRGVRRLRRRHLLIAALLTTLIGSVLFPWGFSSGILLLPLSLWAAAREARFRAYLQNGDSLWFRSGAFDRRTSVVPLARIQGVTVHESPFDRRHRMASLRVDTAGAGPARHSIELRYLDLDRALALQQELTREAAQRPLEW